jgi:hypothetical protein
MEPMSKPNLLALSGLMAALACLPCMAGPAAAQGVPESTECRREVFFTDGSLVASQRRLQDNASAKPAQLCQVWRGHGEVLKKAVASSQRCATMPERAAKMAPAQRDLAEFNEALRQRCKGQ